MLAGGTGIAPMYQLLQAMLKNPNDTTEVGGAVAAKGNFYSGHIRCFTGCPLASSVSPHKQSFSPFPSKSP